MNLNELQRSLRQLRLGGMAAVLETRLRQAQAEPMAPIDLLATLVSDELTRRSDRLLERRRKLTAGTFAAGGDACGLPRSQQDTGQLRFQFQSEDESQYGFRSGCRSPYRP